MAYHGYGVWSLVTQHILTALIPALIFWFYIKWRPQWTFSWQSFKELFSFGFYMFLTNLLNQFGQQIQGLLIGKYFNADTMGYYSKAHDTERVASQSISQVMTQVTYPLYAEVQDDRVTLVNMLKRITTTLAYITFPLLFILMLCARPIFIILYGEKWLPSVPYFQALCIAGLAFCLQSVNNQSIAAVGKSRIMFIWTVVKRTIGISAVVSGLLVWGMRGLLCGVIFSTWFSYFVNISLVSKHIGYKVYRQLLDLLPVMSAALVCGVVTYSICHPLHLSLYFEGALMFVLYSFLYIGWSMFFKPRAYMYFIDIVRNQFKHLKKGVNGND